MPDLERYPTLVSFEELPKELRWDACLEALKSEYTLPFRKACRILKCSRDWVTKYVRPNCHYIYLMNRFGRRADYYAMAKKRIGFDEKDSVWFNEIEFRNLIMSNITSCTRQAISIPIEFLIKSTQVERFRTEYAEVRDGKEPQMKRMEEVVEKYATDIGRDLWKTMASPYARKKSPVISLTVPTFELESMMAVHDLKDYGDTDEMVYRDLFRRGAIRIEISVPDKDGCISKKIYYLEPEDDVNLDNTVESILINYADYVLYKDKFTIWE